MTLPRAMGLTVVTHPPPVHGEEDALLAQDNGRFPGFDSDRRCLEGRDSLPCLVDQIPVVLCLYTLLCAQRVHGIFVERLP